MRSWIRESNNKVGLVVQLYLSLRHYSPAAKGGDPKFSDIVWKKEKPKLKKYTNILDISCFSIIHIFFSLKYEKYNKALSLYFIPLYEQFPAFFLWIQVGLLANVNFFMV